MFKHRKRFYVKTTNMLVKFILFWSKLHFFGWLLKKPIQTQENVRPNFFSKAATELGLLGPKIALRYILTLKILHFWKKRLKGIFSQTVKLHFALNIAKNS